MRSTELSVPAWRRLNEVCEEWAVWYTRRWAERPALQSPSLHEEATDDGDQWLTTGEVADRELRGTAQRVDMAIDNLPQLHRSVLHRWAWQNHYNRGLIRIVEKTETGQRVTHRSVYAGNARASNAPEGAPPAVEVNDETLTRAQLALVPFLGWHNVVLE